MGKHRTRNEWINLFIKYERDWCIPNEYFDRVNYKEGSKAKLRRHRKHSVKLQQSTFRFINKYKQWKMLDNLFMNKMENRGRKKKRSKKELEDAVDQLTEEQLKEVALRYLEIQEENVNKKKESEKFGWTISKKAMFFGIHRTTLYKKCKKRIYKFDFAKPTALKEFYKSKCIYGSQRLSIVLESYGISISPRTLRNYMNRWGISPTTRVKRRKSESKNTSVKYGDLVKRNYNPIKDNIIATDVSYIPANVGQNNIYLSVAISHKTKLIESWELSEINDTELVLKTLNNLNRSDFIVHSDHGSQYSAIEVQNKLKEIKGKTSMGRVGNSLDNREVEYFFGCLKGEYLNRINTYKMNLREIKDHINWYINWYNTKRIQKRLHRHWLLPVFFIAIFFVFFLYCIKLYISLYVFWFHRMTFYEYLNDLNTLL